MGAQVNRTLVATKAVATEADAASRKQQQELELVNQTALNAAAAEAEELTRVNGTATTAEAIARATATKTSEQAHEIKQVDTASRKQRQDIEHVNQTDVSVEAASQKQENKLDAVNHTASIALKLARRALNRTKAADVK